MHQKKARMHKAKPPQRGTHKSAANASHRTLILWLSALLVVAIALSGWHPHLPADWYVEHILVLAAAPVLWLLYRKLPLSVVSWVGIFLFLYIHELGAHFTYSKVPYDEWTRSWFGFSLNGYFGWERNHFDRLVHFTYGLLLAFPLKEIITGWCRLRGFWPWFFALDLVLSSSAFYELLEWAAALVFSEEVGTAYLGTQGDVWDAHKDIVLAVIGGIITLTIAIVIESRRRGRVFWQEWRESLRVKDGGS